MPAECDTVTPPETLRRDAVGEGPRFLDEMNSLTAFHAERCRPYRRILDAAYSGRTVCQSLPELPLLPVRLFKEFDLYSVSTEQVVKTLTSSGTSGQRPSRIFLDKTTGSAQAHALVRIVRSYLGNKRLPMIILDHVDVLKDRHSFSARGAGILGFSQFGADVTYALTSQTMAPDWDLIESFLARHGSQRILLFGFTFILWQHLLRAAEDHGRTRFRR